MTNEQKTQAVLSFIRHMKGMEHLLELSFGCEVRIGSYKRVVDKVVIEWENIIIDHAKTHDYGDVVKSDEKVFLARNKSFFTDRSLGYLHEELTEYTICNTDDNVFEIIGHPVQWSDVLIAIENSKSSKNKYWGISCDGEIFEYADKIIVWKHIPVDLRKSTEDNMLADPTLTGWLANLLGV